MKRMWSKNEIVNVLKDRNIVAKTLKQTQPNYSLDISTLPVNDKPANLDYECVYGKVEEINGVLYIVWTCKWINNTESTISLTNMSLLVEVSEDIAKRIIDFDGKSVNESNGAEISADVGFKGDASYPSALNRIQFGARITNASAVNKMYVSVYIGGGTINAGQTQLMSFRTFLTLL